VIGRAKSSCRYLATNQRHALKRINGSKRDTSAPPRLRV